MKNNLIQELYKLIHQKMTLYGAICLLLLMNYVAITNSNTKSIISQGFGSGQWITIIVITISSNFLAMEYRDNTIITLMYKNRNKWQIYFSKFVVLILYTLFLVILGFVFTLIIKVLIIGNRYSWDQQTLLIELLLNMLGTVIYSFFIISLELLLISFVKVNAAVIGIGLAIGFFGASISNVLLSVFSNLNRIIAWNPLNMINIMNQLSHPNYSQFTKLTNNQFVIGNIIYTTLFLAIGYFIFKKRRV
ncbi:ABC transporter permease [Companilactobacillus keshanensis]|uniref:ABC transporter permease n=1 Tax=Companilactobacillus keshanensis TaxID=2486003 RepID=A0ABW4BRX1_9LACO|nr:ABC transporter permease [Companilactobacillus keshanensis]